MKNSILFYTGLFVAVARYVLFGVFSTDGII